MPDISATIRSITLADASVSALVGSRMYSDILPQKATMPAITYEVVDTIANEHLTGIADVAQARIQINSVAKTRSEAIALADAVRLALQKKHRGDNSGQFINEISLAQGEQTTFDPPEAGTDQRRFVTILEFDVFYRTTTS